MGVFYLLFLKPVYNIFQRIKVNRTGGKLKMPKVKEGYKQDDSTLTIKHRTFLDNWLETGNITQSAIAAGYSAKTAGVRGCNLLKDPRSKSYLEKMKQKLQEHQDNSIANTLEIAEYLTRVMRGEEQDILLRDGKTIPVTITERTKAAVELNKLVSVQMPTQERVIIIDGITRDTE